MGSRILHPRSMASRKIFALAKLLSSALGERTIGMPRLRAKQPGLASIFLGAGSSGGRAFWRAARAPPLRGLVFDRVVRALERLPATFEVYNSNSSIGLGSTDRPPKKTKRARVDS